MTIPILADEMEYRQYLVRLPLQMSTFSALDTAPDVLYLTGDAPTVPVEVFLTESGDLHIDHSQLSVLIGAFEERVTPESAKRVERELYLRERRLSSAVATVETRCATLSPLTARQIVRDLLESVAQILPCGLLSKFVPDALMRVGLRLGETTPPPFQRRSAGSTLSLELYDLGRFCMRFGFEPKLLAAHWPDVPGRVRSAVHTFCRNHQGYGPLPWEAPGFEEPRYTVDVLNEVFGDREVLPPAHPPLRTAVRRGSDGPWHRRLLASWLRFLDYETFFVRCAFYRGVLPLLRVVAAEWPSSAGQLLFLRADELGEPFDDDLVDMAIERRRAYQSTPAYLTRHGISLSRMDALLQGAP